MKALTICQPYAHLIVTPQEGLPAGYTHKRVENRQWKTDYRGPLLIHAGKSRSWLGDSDEQRLPGMAFGCLVGIVDMIACVHSFDVVANDLLFLRNPDEKSIHDLTWLKTHPHTEGPWCWVLDHARRFHEPIEYRGQQGLFDVPDHLIPEWFR